MPEKESSGMLEKVKRGIKMISPFEFKLEAGKNPIAGMNLPVRLARSDCAYNNLTVLFKSRFFMLSDSLRAAYYDLSLKLIDVVISNLTYIQNESDGKSAEDPCLPTLKTIRKILEVLKESAETSLEMATSERGIESFGGPLAIAKIRLVDDSIGDMEIRTQEDFQRLLETDFGEGRYGYGSAWDSAYVYNELSEFINFFGGSYYDWNSPSTREALTFLADMVKKEQTPIEQITDQYEQLEQKFLEGTYASIFVYSGTLDMFVRAGAYREDFIQLAPLPRFKENVTNIAAWQYVLNKSSANKEAAIRFLKYAASREGSIAYAEYMNRLPVRLDIIREEDLDIPGFEQLREYVENTELKERPFSRNTMEDITSMGALFQRYVLEEISLEEFCKGAQNITDGF